MYKNFLIFLINICHSMRRSFIVPEGTYKAKAAFVLFLVLKKTYLSAGLIIICSIEGAVLFGSTGSPRVCVFPRGIMVSASRGSLMSNRRVEREWGVGLASVAFGLTRIFLIPPVLAGVMLCVASILAGRVGRGL